MMYKIEKGVPIPDRRLKIIKYPWETMDIGDSFFVEGKHTRNLTGAAHNYGKNHNKIFSCRTVNNGVRVWRTA